VYFRSWRKRLRDLFELGDLEKGEYVSKRDAIDTELDALSPAPDLDGARAVLEDFGRFWDDARDPEARRELLQQRFELVWIDGHKIVAVRPSPAFAGFFLPGMDNAAPDGTAMCKERERRESNPGFLPHLHRGPVLEPVQARDPPNAWFTRSTPARRASVYVARYRLGARRRRGRDGGG
jgi:hypothetical protein